MMSLAQSRSGSATNGRLPKACKRCAIAKIRCNTAPSSPGGSGCDRCTRLGQQCVSQDPSPPRKKRKKQTRVAQLEEKLDGLISLLGSVEERPVTHSIDLDQSSVKSPQTSVGGSSQSIAWPKSHSDFPELQRSYEGAEEMLDRFRSKMAHYFPFVVIPQDYSPSCLNQNSPMLYQVIMLVTSNTNLFRQRAMEQVVRQSIAERLLFHGEKSLDLLQSLLVLLAWFHYYSCSSSQMTNLLHMVFALVLDLGLNRPPDRKENSRIQLIATRVAHGERVNSTMRTKDERRALLGSFYLHSIISTSFKVVDPPVFSQYMEECCEALLEAEEYSNDIELVDLIRLQSALNRVGQNFQTDYQDFKVPEVPVNLYVKLIQAEVEKYKRSESPTTDREIYAYIAHRTSEVFLLEHAAVALKKSKNIEFEGYKMMEILYSCAQSIKSFFDAYLTMPPASYYHLPLIYWAEAGVALMALARIAFLDRDAWNKADLSKTADGVGFLDRVMENMAQAKKDANLPDNIFFELLRKRMEMVRTWFASQNSVISSKGSTRGTTESITSLEAQATDISLSMIDFNSPGFWNDMSAPLFGANDDGMWREMFGGDFGTATPGDVSAVAI